MNDFVNIKSPVNVEKAVYRDLSDGNIEGTVTITCGNDIKELVTVGNGRLDSVSRAIKEAAGVDYTLDTYTQHALEGKTTSKAASYVSISFGGKTYWGTGIDSDISASSVKALLSAVNKMITTERG